MTSIEPVEPFSRFYVSQRQRLHYVDWGNAEAPPLILVHGGRDNCRNWDWVARAFRDEWHVIAPDLRGHGDSAWSVDGGYSMDSFVYDLSELVRVLGCDRVAMVAHSLGGNIALRYAGIYPEKMARLVSIEGLGPSPVKLAERKKRPLAEHMREWIEKRSDIAGRLPRRYPSFEEALVRMREENKHLNAERARHLTIHGTIRNEDGSYSWKFDNYVRSMPPDLALIQPDELWTAIECPTLLIYGADSWASNPATDGRAAYFRNAEVSLVERAGHFVHHDQHDVFVAQVRAFLTREA
jgi:pimeloyl-ACP methyl ester carboxylesterase